ncbi:hypothetical protein BJ138DRAFT_1006568 [Hygrophoropsis aurantiaca]|uniref:Uncharacterized protein n=1 Tax=Hygrophoropsis aurantiaca TaxID=72124 RepID=A0ACB8ADZ8_9AGAM|nr:hypothetical protein BJ138DRAFT_1006568 [Hygrophoropsis aurantiaca]
MEENKGADRGSYIWGRQVTCFVPIVHNTRIEHLWYDVTHGFGQKWKNFFLDLEANHGLNPRLPSHIWLLHHLFLDRINDDAEEWKHTWNSHSLQIRGERTRSPRDIFLFSMIEDGPRGIEALLAPPEEEVDDLATYGVDWDVINDPVLMEHLRLHNPHEQDNNNPFSSGPATLSEVPCEPPNCPLHLDQIIELDQQLAHRVDTMSRNMQIRRLVWQEAMDICAGFFN